ncbi:MAG: FliI/YscN family ATPase [Spirochaetaceae bacterium]|nr:MAG: FliI/YscN family ATPase [Spirochaetaceae bacterium]
MSSVLFGKYCDLVDDIDPVKYSGVIDRVQGLLLESIGPQAVVGELCRINLDDGTRSVPAEVIGLHGNRVQLMAYEDVDGIEVGCTVTGGGSVLRVAVGDHLLGRVLNGRGRPIDGLGEIHSSNYYPVNSEPPDVLTRSRITRPIETGVRAIDGLVPVGTGQRMGIFSGSGVGKSTLLGMIARNTNAAVNVIALIGERGREVREFIENDLGPEGLQRSVVVVATSDMPPLARYRAAGVATAIAEYFRDQGNDVMFLFDSVTRYARAIREISLARGEFPANRGYTPSVFSGLPKLLERCGTSEVGTMTGFYTILVEGDDMDEPVSDTVRGILDGHLVLSRRLAQRAHYPAIDVLASISRLENRITDETTRRAVAALRRHLAVYTENEDIISLGAYARGSQPEIDSAIEKIDAIRTFLQQGVEEKAPLEETISRVCELAGVSRP